MKLVGLLALIWPATTWQALYHRNWEAWASCENWTCAATRPPEIGNLKNLETLRLSSTRLSGEIPPELGNLTRLKVLELRKNNFTGLIPSELGNLANLELLDLYVNKLSGPVPPELGGLGQLSHLELGCNELHGELPPDLGRLAALEYLGIRGNQLAGEIPPELGRLSNLQRLDIRGNRLTGNIPPQLGNLTNLVELNLAGNQLSGSIPRQFSDLARVEILNLANNLLSGKIPSELADLNRLLELGLGKNQFDGCIPASLKVQYYIPEETSLAFCEDSPATGPDTGQQEIADFLGPSTTYIDPALISLLYAYRAGDDTTKSLRVRIIPAEYPLTPDLHAFIKEGGGEAAGQDVWNLPIRLAASVVCHTDTGSVVLVEPDGTPSWVVRSNPYPNLHDALTDAVIAYQGGMPEDQAALYVFGARGSSITVLILTKDAATEQRIRAWLSQRNIYAPRNPDRYDDEISLLLPVSLILPLAQEFPEEFLLADSIKEQGLLSMLRLHWEPQLLHFEKRLTQLYLDPDTNPAQDSRGASIVPCSTEQSTR